MLETPAIPAASGGIVLAGLGTHTRVNGQGPGAEAFHTLMQDLWARCLADGEEAAGQVDVEVPADYVDALGRALGAHNVDAGLERLLERMTQRITLALIAQQAGRILMLHAGGVCDPDTGASLVYVAPSQTGKTTLTAELGHRFGYLTDETIAMDEDLRILPYPKPLSMRDPAGGPRRELSPDDLGLLPAHPQPWLRRLLYLDRDDGHDGPPELVELGLLEAVELLVPQTSSLGRLPRGLHRFEDITRRTGPILKVRYRDASDMAEVAERLLAEEPVVCRVEPGDVLERGGESLLLYDDHVVRLGLLGGAVFEECARPICLTSLAMGLRDRFGSAGDAGDELDLTRAAVDDLLAQGVLASGDGA